MRKHSYKKDNYRHESPVLQRVESRHALLGMPSTSISSNWQWHEMAASATRRESIESPPSSSNLSDDSSGNNLDNSSRSKLVIKDSHLTSSWLYNSKKAAANGSFEENSSDPVTPTKNNSTKDIGDIESPRPEFSPFPIASRKRSQSTCCCYMAVLLITFVCIFGILSSIGGIIYLEIITSGNAKANIPTDISPIPISDTMLTTTMTKIFDVTESQNPTEIENGNEDTSKTGKIYTLTEANKQDHSNDNSNNLINNTVKEEHTTEIKYLIPITTEASVGTDISVEEIGGNTDVVDCSKITDLNECNSRNMTISILTSTERDVAEETTSKVLPDDFSESFLPGRRGDAWPEQLQKYRPLPPDLSDSIAKVVRRFQSLDLSHLPSSRVKDSEKTSRLEKQVETEEDEKKNYLDRLRVMMFEGL